MATKAEFLQVRLSRAEKRALAKAAEGAAMTVSAYVLARCLPTADDRFARACAHLRASTEPTFALAGVHDVLASLAAEALTTLPAPALAAASFEAAYVASMVEQAAARATVRAPRWCCRVPPLERPWFASTLESLRAHLLTASPPAFRARNLFVDATVGDRV